MFSKKAIQCPAGEWTVLANTIASGMSRTYQFQFSGDQIEGEFRVSKSVLPFGLGLSTSQTGELRPRMSFDQGAFDASYRLEVNPKATIQAQPQ